MPRAQSSGFDLVKATVNAEGELILRGLVALPQVGNSSPAAFVVVGRKSKVERKYPALLDAAGQNCEVTGRMPLRELDLGGDTLADVFFVREAQGREERTRVTWQLHSARWLPYPTKFGNLSLKRK